MIFRLSTPKNMGANGPTPTPMGSMDSRAV